MENKKLTLNKAQILAVGNFSLSNVLFWSRGTGKSYVLAFIMQILAHKMPRSVNGFVGRTFNQLLTRILPGIFAALEDFGYYENVHYVIGKRPPEEWLKPIQKQVKYEFTITWYTGATWVLISQEREGSARGLNLDSVMADEGITLHRERFEAEAKAANRGNLTRFGHLPYHHNVTVTSSKPIGTQGRWLLDYGKYYENQFNYKVLSLAFKAAMLILEVLKASSADKPKAWQELVAVLKQIKWYKSKENTYYSEAFSLDNIENLGWAYLQNNFNDNTDGLAYFLVEYLNVTIGTISDKFYADFDEEKHGYFADRNELDLMSYKFKGDEKKDCSTDTDVSFTEPLDIAMDYNYTICPIVTGQEFSKEYRILSSDHVKFPQTNRIETVIDNWHNYYSPMQTRRVNYYFNHTAVGLSAGKDTSHSDDVILALRSRGWNVNPIYTGQAPNHDPLFRFWGALLSGKNKELPLFRINRENNKSLIISLNSAPAKQGRKGVEKDKSSEDPRKKLPQEHATHYSEALDMLMYPKFAKNLKAVGSFEDPFVG